MIGSANEVLKNSEEKFFFLFYQDWNEGGNIKNINLTNKYGFRWIFIGMLKKLVKGELKTKKKSAEGNISISLF